jgi:hypothetical protein
MKAAVVLNEAERGSTTWQKVEHELNRRLAYYRAKLENPREVEAERLGCAWRIQELKEILKMGEEPKPQQDAG